MKKIFRRLSLLAVCFLISTNLLSAQTAEDALSENQMETGSSSDFVVNSDEVLDLSEDFDSLFDDSEDTEAIVTAPVDENKKDDKRRGIILTGNLESRLGGYFYVYPAEVAPGATFDSIVSFSSNPNQYFGIKGSLLANFPKMEVGLYELYINYSLWDFAFITAGKKEVKWGNARIFDTNVLDDNSGKTNKEADRNKNNPENLLLDNPLDKDDAKFTVMVSVPFWKFNLTGLVTYADYLNNYQPDKKPTDEWRKEIYRDFAYAAMLEANINNISCDFFFKSWALNDISYLPPAIGFDVNFQLRDFHFYLQYLTHLDTEKDRLFAPRMKGTASVWWATRDKINLGFVLEYQFILDWQGLGLEETEKADASKYLKHYLAFEGVWGRINGSRYTLAVKYLHDFYEHYGTIVPGLKIHSILPNADLDFGVPLYYGSQFKVGFGLQLKLNVNF